MGICSIPDCNLVVLAKSFCRKHYLRNYRHGNPLKLANRQIYIKRGVDSVNYKHGMWDNPLYKVWRNMISRCENSKDAAFKNYGGRGIMVCDRWHNIAAFVEDMGERPKNHTLERTDNQRGYNPENCVWATRTAQSRNRRFCKLTIELAEKLRAARASGVTRKQLALMFSVSEATVKKVISGAYWVSEKSKK